MKIVAIAALAATLAAPVSADISVRFIEGAPKDRFVITNTGSCALQSLSVNISFVETPAGVIFDTTGSGAGVEVYQPFEIVEGADVLEQMPVISDGDQVASLALSGLEQDQTFAFTIDVDDTAGTRGITVSRGEMQGTDVTVAAKGKMYSASFQGSSDVTIPMQVCAS